MTQRFEALRFDVRAARPSRAALARLACVIGCCVLAYAHSGTARAEGWLAVAPMSESRSGHTATLLDDGEVLVAGGGPASAERYNEAANSWRITAPMNVARVYHTATKLASGKVLVAGGGVASAEIYDPIADTWTMVAPMPYSRTNHTATLLLSGQVLVAGGYTDDPEPSTTYLYNAPTNTWSSGGAMSSTAWHTATRLNDGRVLVAGGEPGGYTTELYNPVTNTWSAGAPMNWWRARYPAVLLLDGRVMVSGGNEDFFAFDSPTEVYDAASDTWTLIPDLPGGRRLYHSMTVLQNGDVVGAGGHYHRSFVDMDLTTTYRYNVATNTWSSAGLMSHPRAQHTATLMPSGRVLVAGPGTSADVYDPPSMPPSAPGNVVATAGNRRARIDFDGSLFSGASPILYYTATSSPGGFTASGPPPLGVTGLTNGVSYTFTVTATNAIGTGPPSLPSNPVVPAGQAMSYVASWGVDASVCTTVFPCRSFAVAVDTIDDGGAVIALDSAGYGPVTISRPARIEAPAGIYAAISVKAGSTGVTVDPAGGDVVLRGLTIKGQGGDNGIAVTGNGRIAIERCRIDDMANNGIDIRGSGVQASIKDSRVALSGSVGIVIANGARAELDRVGIDASATGALLVSSGATAQVNASWLTQNGYGVDVENTTAGSETRVVLSRSVVSDNATFGVRTFADGGFAASAAIARSRIVDNLGSGALADTGPAGTSTLTLSQSTVSGNGAYGARATGAAAVRVGRSTIAGNALEGLSQAGAAEVRSLGNNAVHSNNGAGAQTSGTITPLAPM